VAWCLVMQEAMMFANWPIEVLQYDRFRIEKSASGALLFRGPR